MAREWFSESNENESPSEHVLTYGEKLIEPDNSRYDILFALENLVRNELHLNEEQLHTFLEGHEAKLLDYERALADDEEIEDKGRLQAELYAMAPLILLWRELRHLRQPEDAMEWLEEAVDLALNEADAHEECLCDDVTSESNDCELSPLCPMEMVAKTLAADALMKPKPGDAILEDPSIATSMMKLQLILAGQKGLLDDRQIKVLRRNYHKNRRSRFLSDDKEG